MLIKRDKWLQYRILRKGSSLAGRLPETQLLKKNALTNMLLHYQSVVLKPHNGNYGRDILFTKRNGANAYRIHNEKKARLGERYPKLRQVGFDIGIDRNCRIWIIEGNYQPDLRPFRLLKDSSMHRRILWYKKH
ncbi:MULTISPECIES: YheC/YheD family protein [unclassified Paenibacillus]